MVMKEQISALMDDELDADSSQHLFTALKSDAELGASWSTYHLIGDTLRGNCCLHAGFRERLLQKLEQEPTVLAPRNGAARLVKPPFMLSAGAAVAAVAFVGWMAWSQQHLQTPEQALSPSLAQNNVSPEVMNSYLLAHQEFSSSGDMQAASYIRPVAFAGNGN
ncbi:MAG: anti-sigma 24 factor [Nitrosomonadales bacterium]|nr:MAG: anti-sigma 24 factor [Nitrosomonadales bacterium]